MNSSTPTISLKLTGRCVVCGTFSTTRCGDCASAGTDWIFFCSREHQKLICKFHKRVCKNRFLWPAFTQEEIDRALDTSHKPFPDKYSPPILSLPGLTPDQVKEDPLGAYEAAMKRVAEPNDGTVLSQSEHRNIVWLRTIALTNRTMTSFHGRKATHLEVAMTIIEEPVNVWAWQQVNAFPGLDLSHDAPWYDTFQQRFFIFSTLSHLYMSGPPPRDEIEGYLLYAYQEWMDFIKNVVSKDNPTILEDAIDHWRAHTSIPFPDGRRVWLHNLDR